MPDPHNPQWPGARAAGRIKSRVKWQLPASLPPRGLNRDQAADYVGVGGTKFDEMVADGRMPKPKIIDGRRVWDRYLIDDHFSSLPDDEDRSEWDAVI